VPSIASRQVLCSDLLILLTASTDFEARANPEGGRGWGFGEYFSTNGGRSSGLKSE
jgi:hypothetical protein